MRFILNKWIILTTALLLWIGLGIYLYAPTPAQSQPASKPVKTPQRIICTAPNLVEIVCSLGLIDNLVGIPNSSTFPPEVKDIPRIGSFWQPSIEPIIAKRPDLVITLAFNQQQALAARLNRLGYKTITVDIEQIDDFYAATKTIGTATNKVDKAEKLITDMQQNFANYSKNNPIESSPKILWVVWRDPLRVAGTDTFINDLIEYAGGQNALGPTLHQYPPIGSEQVIAANPDIIIEPAMSGINHAVQLKSAKEYWQKFNIPATTNNRIYVIDGDPVSQLGPRLYEGLKLIGECLSPKTEPIQNKITNPETTDNIQNAQPAISQ